MRESCFCDKKSFGKFSHWFSSARSKKFQLLDPFFFVGRESMCFWRLMIILNFELKICIPIHEKFRSYQVVAALCCELIYDAPTSQCQKCDELLWIFYDEIFQVNLSFHSTFPQQHQQTPPCLQAELIFLFFPSEKIFRKLRLSCTFPSQQHNWVWPESSLKLCRTMCRRHNTFSKFIFSLVRPSWCAERDQKQ